MKIIYGNIIWFAVVIYGLIGAAIQRHNSIQWNSMKDIRYEYDLMYGSIAICLIATIIGLLIKRKWGYTLAQTANATLTAIPLSLFFAALFFTLPALDILQVLKTSSINLVSGFISLVFFIGLMKTKKEYQDKCRL